MKWLDCPSPYPVENIVQPGGWLTAPGKHLASCNCQCANVQTCPECKKPSWVSSVRGRWDAEAGYTARPFDPVWVRLGCGCAFGDESLAEPDAMVRARIGGGL